MPFHSLLANVPDSSTVASERGFYALARGQWANLLLAMQCGHLPKNEVKHFLGVFQKALVARAGTGLVNANAFLALFADQVLAADRSMGARRRYAFKDRRRAALRTWTGHIPVTVQTCYVLHFWFEDTGIHGIESLKPSNTTIKRAMEYWRDRRHNLPDTRFVGKEGEAVWFTPTTAIGGIVAGVPNDARDRLGLFRNQPPRHAIVALLAENVGKLPGGDKDVGLRAPTVFDARGYERFRHWPRARPAVEENAGRTYELDEARRKADADYGCPELIHVPQRLNACFRIIHDGAYSVVADMSLAAHEEFADDVAVGLDLKEIVKRVVDHVS